MKRTALVAGISFAALLIAGPAKVQALGSAESFWSNARAAASDTPARKSGKARSKTTEKAADKSPPIPAGPLHIIVSIDKQRATLFADGHPVASTAVSTGTPGHPTPMGLFTVIQKDRHHVSNLYNASMPYMQRITWSGSALHQGPLPGYPASHGCVRLSDSFAQLLWKTTKMGARIIITRPEVAPLEFAHARLFAPKPRMVAAPPAVVPAPAPVEVAPLAAVTVPVPVVVAAPAVVPLPIPAPLMAAEPAITSSVTKVRTADAANALAVAIDTVAPEATKAVTTEVVTEPVASTAAEQPTKQADTDGVGGRPEAAAVEPAEVKAAEEPAVEAKPDQTASVAAKPEEGKSEEAKPVEAKAVETKPVQIKPAEVKQAEAKPVEAHIIPIAAPAPIIVDERPKTMPATVVQEANGRPISVLVSLKEKKLYVRQGWKPLFDVPVSFENPEQPIGTHVYTAMNAKADGSLRWTVVSIPSATRRVVEAKNDSGRRGRQEHAVKTVDFVAPMPNPSDALDRIVMTPELIDRISDMITPGSSLIVSDNRLSDETGEYTDFIVTTR